MPGLTRRNKFDAGFVAVLAMIAALTFTSVSAMSSLNFKGDSCLEKNREYHANCYNSDGSFVPARGG